MTCECHSKENKLVPFSLLIVQCVPDPGMGADACTAGNAVNLLAQQSTCCHRTHTIVPELPRLLLRFGTSVPVKQVRTWCSVPSLLPASPVISCAADQRPALFPLHLPADPFFDTNGGSPSYCARLLEHAMRLPSYVVLVPGPLSGVLHSHVLLHCSCYNSEHVLLGLSVPCVVTLWCLWCLGAIGVLCCVRVCARLKATE